MAFPDFLSSSRMKNIFGQPVDRSGMSGFNPAIPERTRKRLFTDIVPEQPRQTVSPIPPPELPYNQLGEDPFKRRPEPAPQQKRRPGDDEMERYFNLLQAADKNKPAMTAYQEAIQKQPQPQDYKPSAWRILAGTIGGAAEGFRSGGAAGAEVAENITKAPYRQQMENYKLQLEANRMAAELEQSNISDYKQNLAAAANYGATRGKQERDDYFQQREWENKDFSETTERLKEDREFKNTMSEIQRRLDQTFDEGARRQIERERDAEIVRNHNALESIGRTNAGANVTSAGASVISAKAAATNAAEASKRTDILGRQAGAAEKQADAAVKRADRPPTGGEIKADEQKDAQDLAMERAMSKLPAGAITVTTSDYGPVYNIDPDQQVAAEEAIQEELDKIWSQRGGRNPAAPRPPRDVPGGGGNTIRITPGGGR